MDVAGSIRWTNFKRGKSPRTVEACNLRQYFKHRSDPSELIISKILKQILILKSVLKLFQITNHAIKYHVILCKAIQYHVISYITLVEKVGIYRNEAVVRCWSAAACFFNHSGNFANPVVKLQNLHSSKLLTQALPSI